MYKLSSNELVKEIDSKVGFMQVLDNTFVIKIKLMLYTFNCEALHFMNSNKNTFKDLNGKEFRKRMQYY